MKGQRLLTVNLTGLLLHVCILHSLSLFSHETRLSTPHHPPLPQSLASFYMKPTGYSCLEFVIRQIVFERFHTTKVKETAQTAT